MKIVRKVITLEEVQRELSDVGEDLNDLSVIRMSFVNDCHYDSYELTVHIFGDGDPDETGPVLELYIEPDALVTKEDLFIGINRLKIPSLFAPEALEALKLRNVRVEWNCGDETEELIDLADPGTGFLLAMIQ